MYFGSYLIHCFVFYFFRLVRIVIVVEVLCVGVKVRVGVGVVCTGRHLFIGGRGSHFSGSCQHEMMSRCVSVYVSVSDSEQSQVELVRATQ